MQASLGYFINPLMNVALGMLVLGERLTRVKLLAVGLAATGVLFLIIEGGRFPWVALCLGTTFALYGLVRKQTRIGAIMGLWVEMLILLPGALAYMVYLDISVTVPGLDYSDYTQFMLVMSGAVSTIPLVFFTSAALRLPLSTLGLFQYIAPTMTLLLAVFLWHEPFTLTHMITFGCIWGGLVIYSIDSFFPAKAKTTA